MERGTWIESEDAAGPDNKMTRRGSALWGWCIERSVPVDIRAACPDTMFSCPAKARGLTDNPRTWTQGYVFVEDGVLRFMHEEPLL